MVTAIWSNDPEFYKTILGDDSLLEKIFIKMNYTDVGAIIERFGMSAIDGNEVFAKLGSKKYICAVSKNKDDVLKKIKKAIKTS